MATSSYHLPTNCKLYFLTTMTVVLFTVVYLVTYTEIIWVFMLTFFSPKGPRILKLRWSVPNARALFQRFHSSSNRDSPLLLAILAFCWPSALLRPQSHLLLSLLPLLRLSAPALLDSSPAAPAENKSLLNKLLTFVQSPIR